jgi:hypothetical protein
MTQSGQQGGLDRVHMVQPNRAKGRAGVLNFGVRDSFATGPTTIGKAKAVALAMVADAGMGKVLNDPIRHLDGLAARLLDVEVAQA